MPRLLNPPERILMGPGPANVHPLVRQAMGAPVLGHLDPKFIAIMDEVTEMLRQVFRTKNHATIPISGTGSAGMEAAICNVVEPGDNVVIGMHGYFGERIGDMVGRYGGNVIRAEGTWGKPLDPNVVEAALDSVGEVKMLAIVHAETSTGVLQPLEPLVAMAHARGALFVADCVTSLGGVNVDVDGWGIDIAYSGTQKCIGAPPGLAPITFSDQAIEVIRARKSKVPNWYLDMTSLLQYWEDQGGKRVYHHTAPISMIYALYQALALILDEGLDNRHARHRVNTTALYAGLEAIGLKLVVEPAYRAYPLTTVYVPDGVADAEVRSALLNDHDIEIGAGLGPLAGKAWRIGLMGHTSAAKNIFAFFGALENVLIGQGYEVQRGTGTAAAELSLEGVAAV